MRELNMGPGGATAAGMPRTSIYDSGEWPRIRPAWCELAAASQDSSFFLSPAWVETWLEVFGARLNTTILVFEDKAGPVGACLLVRANRRFGIIPLERLSLNASGEDDADTTYIEFNHVLSRPGWERGAAAALAEYVSSLRWDEFALDGFRRGPGYDEIKRSLRECDVAERWQPSPYVDLAALRRSGERYDSVIGSHHRRLLRQNIHHYSALGDIRLDHAGDVDDALRILEELGGLNRRRFASLGKRSVFESPSFVTFHQRLIRKCFCDGSVRLMRLAAGSRTIGEFYCFVYRGKVYYYQGGFDYSIDRRLSPGLMTLTHAVQYFLDAGLDDLDFLAGDTQMKRSLSTDSRDLVWAVFQRRTLKTRMCAAVRAARRALYPIRGA